MLHIQTYHNSNFPLLKYASNVPCFMQVCAALKGRTYYGWLCKSHQLTSPLRKNMRQLRTDYLFKALDHLGYIVLFLIGYYFIYEGNVVEKFQQRKTNFAAAVDNVMEYPTIVTWIEYNQPTENLILGWDFNISISLDWNTWIYLEKGQNYLDGDFPTIFYLEEILSSQTLESTSIF